MDWQLWFWGWVSWTVGGGEDCVSVQQRSGGAGEKYLVFDAFYLSLFLYSLDAFGFLWYISVFVHLQSFVSQSHVIIALKGGEVQVLLLLRSLSIYASFMTSFSSSS